MKVLCFLAARRLADFHVRAESRKGREGAVMLGVDCVCGNESCGGVAQSGECFGEGSDPEGTGKALYFNR